MRRQVIWLTASRGLSSIMQALAFIMLGRSTGPEVVGYIGAVSGAALIALTIADLGATTLLSKARAVKNHSLVAGLVRVNRVTTGVSMLLGVAGIFLLWGVSPLTLGIGAFVASLALEKNTDALLSIAIADGANRTAATSLIARRIALIVVFMILLSAGVEAALAFGFSSLVGALLGQVHIWLFTRSVIVASDAPALGRLVLSAAPYLLSNISAASRALDATICVALLGPTAGGLYSSASRIVNPFYLVPGVLNSVLLPHAARSDPSQVWKLAKLLAVSTLLACVTLVPVIVFSPVIVGLFGPEFRAAGPVLAALLCGLPFVAVASPLGSLLQSQNAEKFVAINGVVFALISLVAVAVAFLLQGVVAGALTLGLSYLAKSSVLFCKIHAMRSTAA